MVITRKIEVFICEKDKDIKESYYQKLYENRNIAVKAANMCASHLFALDNTMPYLSDKDKETITFLGVKGNKATRANAPYVAASEAFKGKADMGMLSCVLQNVSKNYEEDKKKGGAWKKSLRSYKADMPVPFKKERFLNLRFEKYIAGDGKEKEGCFFTLIGILFQMKFGIDRSNNRIIVERVIDGTYKMCTSSIKIKGNKIFLLLCVDIPNKDYIPVKGKKLNVFLGVMNPIICYIAPKDDIKQKVEVYLKKVKLFNIGTKEEFNYRRRQIQEAVKRCQKENKYATGGKGCKRKTQALERYHEKEKNYVATKLHTYSKMLVDYAVANRCSEIVLLNQISREDKAKEDNQKGEPFVLRNWSYYGLKERIGYKAKIFGIKVTEIKEKKEKNIKS